MFDQNPDVIMPICDLKKELENAWDELIEEGAVIIVDENETTRVLRQGSTDAPDAERILQEPFINRPPKEQAAGERDRR